MFNIDEIYSVSEFLSLCNKTVEDNIPTCWLQGEISNLSRPASGHWYFSLKDDKGQIRCALFRMAQRNIKFSPENGMEVLVHASPTLYESRGDFQIIIQKIEPVGVGNLQLAFDQLKNKLRDEGLFDPVHKKPLPSKANTIGIISSSNGAVIRDICEILRKRYPFADILLFDSVVQGEGSAKKLAHALNIADSSNRCDILILARGGGSVEDLWAFNEEILARTIYKANTPIISAIGHETDVTITDFVCDVRAPTPSAAAVIATPDRLELLANSDKLLLSLNRAFNEVVNSYSKTLTNLLQRMSIPSNQVNYYSQRLDRITSYLNYHIRNILNLNSAKLSNVFGQLKQHSPRANIQFKKDINAISRRRLVHQVRQLTIKNKNSLDGLDIRLMQSIEGLIMSNRNTLSGYASGLNHLSPLSTLSRGYSITSDENNTILLSTDDIKVSDTITTQLSDGKIHSKVNNIDKI
jgi:exodeoxyribonuclease VII large subunit